MRAIRVRLAIGRPSTSRQSRSTSAFTSSATLSHPRKLPPDFPRRIPAYAYAPVEDSQGPLVSPKPSETETDQDQEKPRRRVGRPPGSPNKPPPPPPPPTTKASVNPESIWAGKTLGEGDARTLPPEDMLQDALAQLLVTLQPQTQYRAAYSTNGLPLVEPTLALYCPIEGGDYVIDDTVKELASRVNGDVIVVDAAQLAAGEHGSFGKAASILKFPHNPLHFPSTGSPASRPISEDPDTDDDDLDDDDEPDSSIQRVTFGNVSAVAIPARALRMRGNPLVPGSSSSGSGRDTPMGQSELKNFFESIINAPVPSSSPSSTQPRPRIIYLRDFSLLAPSAHTWYPALLSAIRSRRQGHLLRPSNPLPHPTTLVLGVSPSSVPSLSSSPSPGPPSPASGIMNILMGQRPRIVPTPVASRESGANQDERELRLRERLKRWSRTGSVLDNLPSFASQRSPAAGPTGFMSANGFTSLFGAHPSSAREQANEGTNSGGVSVGTGNKSGYFRACGVVPATRDEARERNVRRARRLEVNTLVVRMAMGAVGAKLVGSTGMLARPSKSKKEMDETEKDKEKPDAIPTDKMVDDWSRKVLDWSSARRLADRALACSILTNTPPVEPIVLDETAPIHEAAAAEEMGASGTNGAGGIPLATPVSWESVRTAWDTLRLSLGYGEKKAESSGTTTTPASDSTTTPTINPSPTGSSSASSTTPTSTPKWSGIGSPREPVPWIDAVLAPPVPTIGVDGKPAESGAEDDLVEQVKNDPELEPHEDRLLGCIVNPAELQTTFAQVHLPDATIDSVRTIVSLPLLYPAAFRSGILAQHAMNGALLFGPPGTGKTLLARALAKESGARMMVVKPSDVMDMYVGEGEKLVRSVFSLARRLSPCIVFLDEIDALLGARSSRDIGGAASAHRGLVTEFMQEMDGLRSSASSNVVVIGATNRPFDLDDAVLRRLPRRLLIDLPGLEEREAILRIMLKGEDVTEDVDIPTLAKQTDGFSGSDLKNLVVSAALDAVKENISLPWRTGSAANKSGDKDNEKLADLPKPDAINIAPDATSSDAPVPGTQATTKPAVVESTQPAEDNAGSTTETVATTTPTQPTVEPTVVRRLTNEHFTRALKDITPSASEALGTLADLRKWNAEFGGGDRKKTNKAWGGRFGFGGSGKRPDGEAASNLPTQARPTTTNAQTTAPTTTATSATLPTMTVPTPTGAPTTTPQYYTAAQYPTRGPIQFTTTPGPPLTPRPSTTTSTAATSTTRPATTTSYTASSAPRPAAPAASFVSTVGAGKQQPKKAPALKGSFTKDLRPMMYAFGDHSNPAPDTVTVMEEILMDYMIDVCTTAMKKTKRTNIQIDGLREALSHPADVKKLARMEELLFMQEDIKRARAQFSEKDDRAAP
ncbi:AAA protein [Rhizoctonia solani]|uniref:AAA protein n=1 Tax=Rhizoctonia solani TaxID=456999 RepID=A0A8H7HEU1_9AGAM|nr:AAA protein [Rhizoctonia solani]